MKTITSEKVKEVIDNNMSDEELKEVSGFVIALYGTTDSGENVHILRHNIGAIVVTGIADRLKLTARKSIDEGSRESFTDSEIKTILGAIKDLKNLSRSL